MKASEVIQRVFEYLQLSLVNSTIEIASEATVSVCDLKEGDVITKPLVSVLPIRDAVAGDFVRQDRISVELQIVCYAPNYFQLGGPGQIDEIVRDAMLIYPENNPPSNFNLVKRFLCTWVDKLTAFQSRQIYQFHIVDN